MSSLELRQQALVTSAARTRAAQAKLLFIGCGLGGQIAVLAARSGCQHFILADADKVELSNLNRQAFYREDVGKNKARSIARLIRRVNPSAVIEVHDANIISDYRSRRLMGKADVVINTADATEDIFFINDYAQTHSELVLFPLNIFWSSYLGVFDGTTPCLDEVTGRNIAGLKLYELLVEKTIKISGGRAAEIREILERTDPNAIPQLGSTSLVTAGLSMWVLQRFFSGLKIKKLPSAYFLDAAA